MAKICRQSGKQFEISALESELHEKLRVPAPTLSPKERMRRLSAFNNYLNLYQVTCAKTGKPALSMFRPDAPFPIYATPIWWSDEWDAADYGREYAPEISFIDQLLSLRDVVPAPARSINYSTLENCDYVNGASFSKNCYLCFLSVHGEDCLFSYNIKGSKDCIDCTSVFECELCYDCTFAVSCYSLRHSTNCRGCSDSYFLADCIGCRNCLGCVGMMQAEYCFFNEQLSKNQYKDKIKEFEFDSVKQIAELRKLFAIHQLVIGRKPFSLFSCDDSSGNYLENCKNTHLSFHGSNLEDCFNCLFVDNAKDCADHYAWGASAELIYCCSRSGNNASNIKFSFLTNGCSSLEYCMICMGCKDCFGCIGLKNKEFHILNKPYSESEYKRIKAAIITQMSHSSNPIDERYGEFLPLRLSMFPYNDSDAMRYFPANKEEVEKLGGNWAEDLESNKYDVSDWKLVPDRTADFPDSLCANAFECPDTGKAFKITARELNVYKKWKLPVPRKHWLKRIEERNNLVAPNYE